MAALARHNWFSAAALAVAALLVGCNSDNSGSALMPSTNGSPPGNSHSGAAHFIIKIPPKKKMGGRNGQPLYVSPGTASMTVAVKGGLVKTFDLMPSSSGCSINPSNGYLTCQEAMRIPSGEQTLTVTLYNLESGKGSPLATATTSVNVAATGFTNIPITLGGIVAVAQVLINGKPTASTPMATATSFPVTIEAYDASGSLIVAPGSYMTPITLTNSDASGVTSFTPPSSGSIRKRDTIQALTATGRGFKPFDTTTINGPGVIATLYYNGGFLGSASITPSIGGTPQASGAAALSGTAAIQEYGLGESGPSGSAGPAGIASGPDGALWFTVTCVGQIGRISTGGAVTLYPLPSGSSAFQGDRFSPIVAGPDGALWFTEKGANNIGRISTNATPGSSAQVTEYSIPTSGSGAVGITAGPDKALWFTEDFVNKIGRITTSGAFTEYPIPISAGSGSEGPGPQGITAGPDGALWFTENSAGKIGRISTSGTISQYAIPGSSASSPSAPTGIAVGPDGALWFAESCSGKIGRITTSGTISQYPIPATGSSPITPEGIAEGGDGALWFTVSGSNKIGRITTSGIITQYPIPTGQSVPMSIAAGPDGALWFAEYAVSNIGRLPF